MPIDALIEFLLEVLSHNPAELHEHLIQRAKNPNNLRTSTVLYKASHLQSRAGKTPMNVLFCIEMLMFKCVNYMPQIKNINVFLKEDKIDIHLDTLYNRKMVISYILFREHA